MAKNDYKQITIKVKSDTAGGLDQIANAEKAGAKVRTKRSGAPADVTTSGGTRNVDFFYKDIKSLEVLQNINKETIAANKVAPKRATPIKYDLVDALNKGINKNLANLPQSYMNVNPKIYLPKNASEELTQAAQKAIKTAEKTIRTRETKARRRPKESGISEEAAIQKRNWKVQNSLERQRQKAYKATERAITKQRNAALKAKRAEETAERKRLGAMENVRKSDHKKTMTRYKTRSNTLRGMSTMSLSANMSMLGIMFSFMSLFTMVSGLFGGLLSAAGNLSGAVSGGALSAAFLDIGNREEGMDVGLLVEGYKKSLGIQGELAYLFSSFASSILSDTEFMSSIEDALKNMAITFSDPEFLRQIVKAAKSFIDMAPDLMNSVKSLLDLTTMIMPWLQMFLPLILSSVILLPLLSLFNAIFGVVMMGFALSNDLLAAILLRTEASRVAGLAVTAAEGLGVPAAAAAGAGAGGILGGLGESIAAAFTGIAVISALFWMAVVFVGFILGGLVVAFMDALGVLDFVGEIGRAFGEWLNTNPFGQVIKDFITLLSAGALLIGGVVVGFVQGGFKGAIDNFWKAIELISGAWDRIADGFWSVIMGAINMFTSAIQNVLDSLWNFSLSDAISSMLGFATGGYVSNTGLAMVHEGEYISNTSQPTSNGNITQEVNITVYGDLDSKAADKVVDELVNQQRYSSWS